MAELMNEKKELRKSLRKQRAELAPEEHRRMSESISLRLQELLVSKFPVLNPSGNSVVVYYPLSQLKEIDLRSFYDWLKIGGYRRLLPITAEDPEQVALGDFEDEAELIEKARGLKEPACSADDAAPQLFIIPALAIDAKGNRLGFGGGYYDRLLARYPQALRVGVLCEFQYQEQLPDEAWDQRLDYAVSEDGVRTFKPRQL